jgi:membrane protein DedA with SNARE-associated domain
MTKYITSILESAGYFGIVFLMFLENVFPPIPSEFIMPLAGFMVTQGKLSFAGTVAAGVVGSMLGTLPFYYLGRRMDEERLKTLADRHGRWLTISREDIEKAQKWFDRHGGLTVLFCRLIPGIRSLISIPAGINRMNFAAFFLYSAVGTAIWTGLLTYLGYFLKSNFAEVEEYLNPASYFIFGAIFLVYVVRVIRHKSSNE